VIIAYNKLLKWTLNSWLASFLAILANNFAPLSKALYATNLWNIELDASALFKNVSDIYHHTADSI
jgi:hypothetical protein